MGFFDSFRVERYPTRYEEQRTAANLDLPEVIIIAITCIFILAFFMIIPGIRGFERLTVFIRVMFSIFVTTVIILTNFGMGWSSSEIQTKVQYKAGTTDQIDAHIGIWLGLRGVNVTLRGVPEVQVNESINYNEHFSWAWRQGKDGFGPDAGVLQKEYRKAKKQGIPYPISWIVDYLTYDGGSLRYGRFCRIAGWYTHILLWLSLPLWILANMLMFMVIRYGAVAMALSGSSMLLSCTVYSGVKNSIMELKIPFEDGFITPQLGWCFYLTLFTGIICIAVALVILLMDLRYPDKIATFFGVDVLQDYEEFYVESNEDKEVPQVTVGDSDNASTAVQMNSAQEPGPQSQLKVRPLLRKRSTSIRFQKSSRRVTILESKPVVAQRGLQGESHTYENVGLMRMDAAAAGAASEESLKTNSNEQIV